MSAARAHAHKHTCRIYRHHHTVITSIHTYTRGTHFCRWSPSSTYTHTKHINIHIHAPVEFEITNTKQDRQQTDGGASFFNMVTPSENISRTYTQMYTLSLTHAPARLSRIKRLNTTTTTAYSYYGVVYICT